MVNREVGIRNILSSHQKTLLELFFDPDHYRRESLLRTQDTNALIADYLRIGWKNGLTPCATFRAARYLNANTGLRTADIDPFTHYLFERVGEEALRLTFAGLTRLDVRRLREQFDPQWYLHSYPDVEASGDDPFIDYMVSGWRRNRNPSPRFETELYLERNEDIDKSGLNPFLHWVLHGRAEGRSGDQGVIEPLSTWTGLSSSEQSVMTDLFDVPYFASAGGDIGAWSSSAAIAEHVSSRWRDGVRSTPSFHALRYIDANPELYETGQSPFLHYLFRKVGEQVLRKSLFILDSDQIQTLCAHFDAAWYLYCYPDIEATGVDAFIHYMTSGWRERRNPTPHFSTAIYLDLYADIAEAGMNPFLHWVLHGKDEGRAAPFTGSFRDRRYDPSVAVVVASTTTSPISAESLTSILQQSYADVTFHIVGEPLSPSALDALKGVAGGKAISLTEHDRGDSLREIDVWRDSIGALTADLVWFADGESLYDADFVARGVSSFADQSVQLAFGRSLIGDDDAGRDSHLAYRGTWLSHYTRYAPDWFSDHLNVDALCNRRWNFLWRRTPLDQNLWHEACRYRHLGVWFLHLHMASGGQVAWVRDAVIRPPAGPSQTPNPLIDADFYQEMARLVVVLRRKWGGFDALIGQCARTLQVPYDAYVRPKTGTSLQSVFDVAGILSNQRNDQHILLVSHGIFAGGAENLPIQLANELVGRGLTVSLLIFKTIDINEQMRRSLHPGVSIYEADWILEYGCEKFVDRARFSVIHSHGVVSEAFFFVRCNAALDIPYIATLHGSYESSSSEDLPEHNIAEFVRRVDRFVYTADKNLAPLVRHDVKAERLTKLPNAMPVDPLPFPRNRQQLGIEEEAVVFTLVARGVKDKGWATAITAFKIVQRHNPKIPMHLLLVGEGEETDRLMSLYGNDPSITFLGYQLRIHGLYRLTDVAVVPTRFAGESFPLCIIQALQAAVPVIATDVGEILGMLDDKGLVGGIVVDNLADDDRFTTQFANSIQKMLDGELRRELSNGAAILGSRYDMGLLTDHYIALYRSEMAKKPATQLVKPVM